MCSKRFAMEPSSMHSTELDELMELIQQLRKMEDDVHIQTRGSYGQDTEPHLQTSNVKYATNMDMMRMVACDSRSHLLLIREQMFRVRIKPRQSRC